MKKKFLIFTICVNTFISFAQAPFAEFQEGLIKDIKALDWISEFLSRQECGMTGFPESMSYPYNSCLWAGEIRRNTESYGSDWWRYEQTAYYTDGLLRLGYLTSNKALIEKGETGIQYTLENVSPEGILGNGAIESMWPMCVYFRVLQAYYEYSSDPRIPAALEKHYLNFPIEKIETWRNIVSLEGMLWTYGKTGNAELLKRCEAAYNGEKFGDLTPSVIQSDKRMIMHGVTCMEELKLPMLLYAYTGNENYLNLAIHAEQKLVNENMLPDGVPASAEALVGNENIINSHETCDIVDYTWTLGYFLQTTGNPVWADKIEKAVFNAGLGCITKDFKSLQYFSSVNQVIATGNSNHNEFFHGSTWMAFRPTHETECCAGNIHRLMPNYISRMWMRDKENAIVAALYGPSKVSFELGNGAKCQITENTRYPFNDKISFDFGLDKEAKFPFRLRIPSWCDNAEILVNGERWQGTPAKDKFITLDRVFKDGDQIIVRFDMEAQVNLIQNHGAYIQRGPLLFSYPVPSVKQEDTEIYENMNGKIPENKAFKCWSITPAGPWNYAITEAGKRSLQVIQKEDFSGRYPFDLDATPVTIRVPLKRIRWTLQEDRFTPPLPSVIIPEKEEEDFVELVPYGCTELRLTVFPLCINK
ncbi:MAG: glycoside hydrolase family 127 protein [Bacteroidales bacterium]